MSKNSTNHSTQDNKKTAITGVFATSSRKDDVNGNSNGGIYLGGQKLYKLLENSDKFYEKNKDRYRSLLRIRRQ